MDSEFPTAILFATIAMLTASISRQRILNTDARARMKRELISEYANRVLRGETKFLPYIKTVNRAKYNAVLRELIEILKALPPEEVDGELNYIFTKLLKEVYPLRYFHINKAIGVLECAKLEYYRRVAAPYEDKKIQESGDV